eukprot:GHVS01014495.1.p1 GENE.GHVS01014495.1~~GHVS01014495.1.p1  ORF type:complete len:129 (-),score=14.57 GHVS01014495.1:392-778(-)
MLLVYMTFKTCSSLYPASLGDVNARTNRKSIIDSVRQKYVNFSQSISIQKRSTSRSSETFRVVVRKREREQGGEEEEEQEHHHQHQLALPKCNPFRVWRVSLQTLRCCPTCVCVLQYHQCLRCVWVLQ